MHKLYWPSENKMAAYMLLRIGWVSQRIRRYLRLFHLQQYFKGKKIRRILKLYGLFLTKWFFGGSKREFAAIFSDMWPPKFLTAKNWLPVRLNGFWRRLNGFQDNRLTTGLATRIAPGAASLIIFWYVGSWDYQSALMIPNDNGMKINYLITISLNTETEDPNFYTSTCTFINTFKFTIRLKSIWKWFVHVPGLFWQK